MFMYIMFVICCFILYVCIYVYICAFVCLYYYMSFPPHFSYASSSLSPGGKNNIYIYYIYIYIERERQTNIDLSFLVVIFYLVSFILHCFLFVCLFKQYFLLTTSPERISKHI